MLWDFWILIKEERGKWGEEEKEDGEEEDGGRKENEEKVEEEKKKMIMLIMISDSLITSQDKAQYFKIYKRSGIH